MNQLLFIETVRTGDGSLRYLNFGREVCKLVEVVEVLCALQKNLLLIIQELICVKVLTVEHLNVLLEGLNLIVKIYKLLCLLLEQKRPVGNIESHQILLSLVDLFKVSCLIALPLQRVCSLLSELSGIIEEHR